MKKTSYRCFFLFAIVPFLISGCGALGAKRVPGDRFDYNAAISQSSREQMLLNIVRSRYLEVPVFLTVSSMVSQYVYSGEVTVGGIREWGASMIDTVAGGMNLGYAERPTITYTPVGGQAFSTHLLSDIPSSILFAAAQAGWSVDILMRIAIHRLGEAENMSFGEVRVKKKIPADLKKLEQFARAIEAYFILSDGEVVEVQQVKRDAEKGKEAEQYLVIAEEVPADLRPVLAEFRRLTGLTKGNRFRITHAITDIEQQEVSVQTRSVMGMIKFMSRGIDVPVEHLEKGWAVDYGLQRGEGAAAKRLFPFRMRSSKNRPENVFAAVRYQDYWFYIDHDDIISKRALNIIQVLFQLKAPATKDSSPLLTLPTG